LLIGESADIILVEKVETLIKNDEDVHAVKTPLTMQLSPEEILLVLNLEFKKGMNGEQIVDSIHRLEGLIKEKFPEIKQIYLEAGTLSEKRVDN